MIFFAEAESTSSAEDGFISTTGGSNFVLAGATSQITATWCMGYEWQPTSMLPQRRSNRGIFAACIQVFRILTHNVTNKPHRLVGKGKGGQSLFPQLLMRIINHNSRI
jgi:hypothetical protein